jgi:hypothetical protein
MSEDHSSAIAGPEFEPGTREWLSYCGTTRAAVAAQALPTRHTVP